MSFDLDSEGAQEKVEEFFSYAINASRQHGVTPEHLSKIWHISPEDARRKIDTTTQTFVQTQDPTLSCNYIPTYTGLFLHGHILCHKERRTIIPRAHVLPTLCYRQRFHIRHTNEKEIQSPSSD